MSAPVSLNVSIKVLSSWASGYIANVTVKNLSSITVSSWTVVLSLPEGQTINSMWDGEFEIDGQTITVTNPSWGGNIPIGGSAIFSMIVNLALFPTPTVLESVGNSDIPAPLPKASILDPLSLSQSYVTASWSNADGATSYALEQDVSSSFSNPLLLSRQNAQISQSYTFPAPQVGTYFYRVQAFNASGAGPHSNVQSLTIQPSSVPVGGFVNHFPVASLPGGMELNQDDVIMSLVSIAENSDIKWWNYYNYIENNRDGRGYTVSICGFCSGTGDLLEVFLELQKINPSHILCKYIPALRKVSGGNVTGLSGLVTDVKNLGDDKQWQTAVWIILLRMYWGPAMDLCAKYGCVLPITKGEMYDTCINFGSDSVESPIISKIKALPPSKGGDEVVWLKEFLAIKRVHITEIDLSLNSGQPDRVDLWVSVLNKGNVNLLRPLNGLSCYGDSFAIL